MTAESSEPKESAETDATAEPLNREERRAQARGKKAGAAVGKHPLDAKKSKVRSQLPNGGVGKFQLPTKNG